VTLPIAAINGFVLFGILWVQVFGDKSTSKLYDGPTRIMHGFAMAALFLSALYCGIRVPVSFGAIPTDVLSCTGQSMVMVFIWTSSKQFLYLFCTARIDVAFRNSQQFKMSSRVFTFLYAMILFGAALQFVVFSLFWRGRRVGDYCASDAPVFTFGIMAIWDITMSATLTVMFIKRLFAAFLSVQGMDSKTNQRWLYKIAKYVTLTIVGVVTTQMALLGVGLTSWLTLASADSMINTWCIFMMYSKNRKWFTVLCTRCHRVTGMCIFCCAGCCNDLNREDFLGAYEEMATRTESQMAKSINLSTTDASAVTSPAGSQISVSPAPVSELNDVDVEVEAGAEVATATTTEE